MNLIGNLRHAFMIEGRGLVIITDREAGIVTTSRFRHGDVLILKNSNGDSLTLSVRSAELALSYGKDYLSFILRDKLNEEDLNEFTEVWSKTNLEQRKNKCK